MLSAKYKYGGVFLIAMLLTSGFFTPTNTVSPTEAAILTGASPGHGPTPKSDLFIFITDIEGYGLEGVNVTITKGTYISTKITPSTGYVEWKKLAHGIYNVSISKYLYQNITDTFNHQQCEILNYTMQYYDTTPPQYSDLKTNSTSPMIYIPNLSVIFNCTWIDAESSIDKVLFFILNQSYLVQNHSNNEYFIIITNLTVNTYDYKWFANDTIGNFNITPTEYLIIVEEATHLLLSINYIDGDTITLTYLPTIFLLESSRPGPIFLYINYLPIISGVGIEHTFLYTFCFLTPGIYNITAFQPATENYNSSSASHLLIVLDNQPPEQIPLSLILIGGAIIGGIILFSTMIGYGIGIASTKKKIKKEINSKKSRKENKFNDESRQIKKANDIINEQLRKRR